MNIPPTNGAGPAASGFPGLRKAGVRATDPVQNRWGKEHWQQLKHALACVTRNFNGAFAADRQPPALLHFAPLQPNDFVKVTDRDEAHVYINAEPAAVIALAPIQLAIQLVETILKETQNLNGLAWFDCNFARADQLILAERDRLIGHYADKRGLDMERYHDFRRLFKETAYDQCFATVKRKIAYSLLAAETSPGRELGSEVAARLPQLRRLVAGPRPRAQMVIYSQMMFELAFLGALAKIGQSNSVCALLRQEAISGGVGRQLALLDLLSIFMDEGPSLERPVKLINAEEDHDIRWLQYQAQYHFWRAPETQAAFFDCAQRISEQFYGLIKIDL
jgi:hypothetical protein